MAVDVRMMMPGGRVGMEGLCRAVVPIVCRAFGAGAARGVPVVVVDVVTRGVLRVIVSCVIVGNGAGALSTTTPPRQSSRQYSQR